MTPRRITVVVPVYRGLDEVARCLASIDRHTQAPPHEVDVVLIDDASPDAGMADLLARFAAEASLPVTVLTNEHNLGFVGTVNRGFRAAPGDVVVLNADTVVTEGWLARMAELVAPGVGTITPLTGFGSICTMPDSVVDAFALRGDAPRIDECARFVTATSLRLRPEVICGVGFCMYVTRSMLDTCGVFDEDAFGKGYGEEVDLCLRATQAGFVHLVDDATFVHHEGGVSFGPERTARMAAASALIAERYPWFRPSNRRERTLDPLAVPFAALELALADRDPTRPHVLQVLHGSPDNLGGTEKHFSLLLDVLHGEMDFSTFHPVDGGFVVRTMWAVDGHPVTHELLLPGGPRGATAAVDEVAAASLTTAIDLLRPDALHIQNLVSHSLAPLVVARGFDGPVLCSVRDLRLSCPNHSVLYRNEVACGLPSDLDACAECLPLTAHRTLDQLLEHRGVVADHIDAVDHWVFASQSAADQVARTYDIPSERVVMLPHGSIVPPGRRRPDLDPTLLLDEPLRVGFVGRGWAKKGMAQVNALARRLSGTDIEVHHFGGPKDPADPTVLAHGAYDNEVLGEMLRAAGIQVVLQPGPFPETFSHVLTEAWAAGLPVIGTRYGAVGERIRATGGGWTILPDDIDGLVELVTMLDACREELVAVTSRVRGIDLEPMTVSAARYAALYRGEGRP